MDFLSGIKGPPRVRAIMSAHKVTNRQIADNQKVTEVYVSNVVNGKRVGHRIRSAIANACGVTVSYIWPDEDSELPQAA